MNNAGVQQTSHSAERTEQQASDSLPSGSIVRHVVYASQPGDNQNTLFTYQTEYYRALSEFAKSLAELEQVVGSEVVR